MQIIQFELSFKHPSARGTVSVDIVLLQKPHIYCTYNRKVLWNKKATGALGTPCVPTERRSSLEAPAVSCDLVLLQTKLALTFHILASRVWVAESSFGESCNFVDVAEKEGGLIRIGCRICLGNVQVKAMPFCRISFIKKRGVLSASYVVYHVSASE